MGALPPNPRDLSLWDHSRCGFRDRPVGPVHTGIRAQRGARVASPQCPILRVGTSEGSKKPAAFGPPNTRSNWTP